MGYYTYYQLACEAVHGFITNKQLEIIQKRFDEITKEEDFFQKLTSGDSVETKWYNHEDDMKKLALEFPNILFTLEEEGEERDDWWIKQFCGNIYRESRAQIIPPSRFNFIDIPEDEDEEDE